MTKKRFDYTAYDDGTESIYDRKKDIYYFDCEFCKLDEVLNELEEENEQLTKLLILIADAESCRSENSVKEILRNTLFGLDTVAGESPNAFKEYSILNKFFKEHYKEHWDNDKYD